jgi:hypothetical protein
MTKQLTPLAKGLITGVLMVIAFLLPYYSGNTSNSTYTTAIWAITWALFAAGIAWTLIDYRNSPRFIPKFGELFKEGFRCFIVAILILILAMMIFFTSNPRYRSEDAQRVREELTLKKTANGQPAYLPKEIDESVAAYKKYYLVGIISVQIFGYLILGSVITAAGSALILTRKR